MNSRQTGAATGLMSNDISGLDEEMISQRVVSEDQAHFILIKGSGLSSREDSQDSQIESDCEKAIKPQELQQQVDITVIPSSDEEEGNDGNLAKSEGQKKIVFQTKTVNKPIQHVNTPSGNESLDLPQEVGDKDSSESHDIESQHVKYDSQSVRLSVKHDTTMTEVTRKVVASEKEDVQTSSDEFIEVPSESDVESMEKTVATSDLFPPSVFQRMTGAGGANPSDMSSKSDLKLLDDNQSTSDVTVLGKQLLEESVAEENNSQSSRIEPGNQDNGLDFQFVALQEDVVEV